MFILIPWVLVKSKLYHCHGRIRLTDCLHARLCCSAICQIRKWRYLFHFFLETWKRLMVRAEWTNWQFLQCSNAFQFFTKVSTNNRQMMYWGNRQKLILSFLTKRNYQWIIRVSRYVDRGRGFDCSNLQLIVCTSCLLGESNWITAILVFVLFYFVISSMRVSYNGEYVNINLCNGWP